MTMQPPNHPDDERLAALAASEPDAVTDSSLVTHVAGCARCAPMVQDIRTLHSALAELPDIRPSRPLRFLPGVPETANQGSGWLGVLRGITAPAMAVAILLIVVGSFGTALSSGIGFMGSAGAAPAAESQNSADAQASAAQPAPATLESGKGQTAQPGSSASPIPAFVGRSASASAIPTASRLGFDSYYGGNPTTEGSGVVREGESPGPPFGWMLGFGVVLLAAAFVARGYVRRRSLA
jgi:hypothetical protein